MHKIKRPKIIHCGDLVCGARAWPTLDGQPIVAMRPVRSLGAEIFSQTIFFNFSAEMNVSHHLPIILSVFRFRKLTFSFYLLSSSSFHFLWMISSKTKIFFCFTFFAKHKDTIFFRLPLEKSFTLDFQHHHHHHQVNPAIETNDLVFHYHQPCRLMFKSTKRPKTTKIACNFTSVSVFLSRLSVPELGQATSRH